MSQRMSSVEQTFFICLAIIMLMVLNALSMIAWVIKKIYHLFRPKREERSDVVPA